MREELARYGTVHSVSVSAFPAIALLWGHAQSATVSAGSLSMSLPEATKMLEEGRGIDRVDMSAQSMRLGSFAMRHVTARQRGSAFYTEGSIGAGELRAAVPGSTEVQLLGSAPGGVEMRVAGNLFGVDASVDALLSVQEGKLVAQPQGIPFLGLVKLTVFSAPHMRLEGFDLAPLPPPPAAGAGGGSGAGAGGDPVYRVRLWATLG